MIAHLDTADLQRSPRFAPIVSKLLPDPLDGPRPCWWWTARAPVSCCPIALPAPDLKDCPRAAALDYFANGWLLTETLFSGLRGAEAFAFEIEGLPMVFHYAHPAALAMRRALDAGLIDAPFNERLDDLFLSAAPSQPRAWPSAQEACSYRARAFAALSKGLSGAPDFEKEAGPIAPSSPAGQLFLAMEQGRELLETSCALVRSMPLDLLQEPSSWPKNAYAGPRSRPESGFAFVCAPSGEALLANGAGRVGDSLDRVRVEAFLASDRMVANADFLEFVEAGGYHELSWWTPAGQAWLAQSQAEMPMFWENGCAGWTLRTIFNCVPLPLDWAACVNFHEAKAYLAWRSSRDGVALRLPSEAEHALLSQGASFQSAGRLDGRRGSMSTAGFLKSQSANMGLAFGSESSVFWAKPGLHGARDAAGNLWEWCDDQSASEDGVEPATAHAVGGSFASAGGEAARGRRLELNRSARRHVGLRAVTDHAPLAQQALSPLELCALLSWREAETAPARAVGISSVAQRMASALTRCAEKLARGVGRMMEAGSCVCCGDEIDNSEPGDSIFKAAPGPVLAPQLNTDVANRPLCGLDLPSLARGPAQQEAPPAELASA
jgi:formylglycine-generating enzyme required for sulfatase activity